MIGKFKFVVQCWIWSCWRAFWHDIWGCCVAYALFPRFFALFPVYKYKYLQVVITHASHMCSQHSFVLVPRATWPRNDGLWGREWPPLMTGMHKMQFDYARFDLLPLVLWSRVFLPYIKWNLRKAQRCSKSVWTFDRCRPHTLTLMAMMWWSEIGLTTVRDVTDSL